MMKRLRCLWRTWGLHEFGQTDYCLHCGKSIWKTYLTR
jgi:hypothetical protein